MRPPTPSHLRFEHYPSGVPVIGAGFDRPRLSWQIPNAPDGFRQQAYEIEVKGDGRTTSTARVLSSDQVLVPWPDDPLQTRERVSVRVRLSSESSHDGDDENGWSDWSEPATIEAGLLRPSDWVARFISPQEFGGLDSPAPRLRGTIDVPSTNIHRARLYITAHGCYVASLNGQPVGDHVLAPGWTSYPHRLSYQAYDVTSLLRSGQNELEILLGNGWYRGQLEASGKRALYGERLSAIAQLEVQDENGEMSLLATDETWAAAESEIVADDLYAGQKTDLRRRARRHFTDAVEVLDEDLGRLVALDRPPVRVTETVPAAEVIASRNGSFIIDFGQNLVGWVRLRVRDKPAGHEVVVRHAELLEDGELATWPLGSAKATDVYVLDGSDEVELEPELTYHGFRFAEVTGLPDITKEDAVAVVIGSDLRRTGWFESSNADLNRLHQNAVWSFRGNYLSIPTACPQRDSRLGWTADVQVSAPAGTFLFDTAGFLRSWLTDLSAEQYDDGSVPFVVPDVLAARTQPVAGWGDTAVFLPWTLYQRTGDVAFLERQMPSMRRWVDCITQLAGSERLWSGGFQLGDWLDPTAPPEQPEKARANPDVLATAHLVRSAEIVASAANELDDSSTAKRYEEIAAGAREAFANSFVTPAGRILSDAPTVYALALEWALLPTEEQREEAGRRLVDLIRVAGFRITTGLIGTPLVNDALMSIGAVDTGYRLLLQKQCPSFLYPLTMGATTLWERWDGVSPDGTLNRASMTSFNHHVFGAIADWLHRTIAGLAPLTPGYREILIHPRPGGGLTSARAAHDTPYGEASVDWSRRNGRFQLTARVPVGARATVHLPGKSEPLHVSHGEHTWDVSDVAPSSRESHAPRTIRELLDDRGRWEAVVETLIESGLASTDVEIADRLGAWLDAPVTNLDEALAYGGLAPVPEDTMARANSAIGFTLGETETIG